MKKIGKAIKKIIIGILAVAFFSFAIGMTILLWNFNKYGVTQINDTSLIILKHEVSSDKYKKGDLILVKSKELSEINPGDELFAYKVDSKSKVTVDFGTVGKVFPDDNAFSYENGSFYDAEFIIGSATKVYEKIGTYLGIVESQWGFLFMILVPSFMIFIYEIYSLIVEIKYSKDEEEFEKKQKADSNDQPKDNIKEDEKDFLK